LYWWNYANPHRIAKWAPYWAGYFYETWFGDFIKATSLVIPEFSEDIHHEIENYRQDNKVGKYIEPKFAHKYYEEISVGTDFTARDLQAIKKEGITLGKAKAFDGLL
jgi:2-keto-4-pentenoate hydratase/2-oxohepta-3-ene-1,7-dioic acid hydratase in catechol pathway